VVKFTSCLNFDFWAATAQKSKFEQDLCYTGSYDRARSGGFNGKTKIFTPDQNPPLIFNHQSGSLLFRSVLGKLPKPIISATEYGK
jgi:hypothetical protein